MSTSSTASRYAEIETQALGAADNSLYMQVLRGMMGSPRRFTREDILDFVAAVDRHIGTHPWHGPYTNDEEARGFFKTIAFSDKPELQAKMTKLLQENFPDDLAPPPKLQDRRGALKTMLGMVGAFGGGVAADQVRGKDLGEDRGLFDTTAGLFGSIAGIAAGDVMGSKQMEKEMNPRDRLMRNLIVHANREQEVGRQ